MPALTQQLGQFIADLSPNRLPEEAVRVAKMGFIDCIGTMIAGRHCLPVSSHFLRNARSPWKTPATFATPSRASIRCRA